MKSNKLRIGTMIAVACLLLIAVWILATPCPATLRPWNAPGYLESVWPPATSETLLSCSTQKGFHPEAKINIGVAINMDSIWELEQPQSSNENLSSFPDRVSIYIDDEKVPITDQAEGGGSYFIGDTELDLAGWYFLGSDHFVAPGNHQAKMKIATRSGKVLEYEWHFIMK